MVRRLFRWLVTGAAIGFLYIGYVYLTLPDVRPLVTVNPTSTAFMALRTREAAEEGKKFAIRHRWVPYPQISNNLRRAVLVAEDSAFFDHEGVDLKELRASLELNWEEGRFSRGGSTITQQLAKNLYLSPSRNPMRKVKELLITRRLEAALTKRRILEIYLNVIEWGDGIFGCEAAARAYFGKSASALSPEEGALLAGAIINPREHSPARPTARLRRRQQIIIRRMGIKPPAPATVEAPSVAPTEPPAIEAPGVPVVPASEPTNAPPPSPNPATVPPHSGNSPAAIPSMNSSPRSRSDSA
ncbi:MAG TPA: monofunctional biosynthetic peptidoglycan transglycosylase [Vicinamibacterales bacterium]|nr:monofunctional biosynthetic peptidoglycan transglycosylase [Vicinamibacterales bacterium]